MKKLIYSVMLLLAATALAIAGLEMFTSYSGSKSINQDAPVQTTKSIIIKASPKRIFSIMSRIDQWPQWHTDVESTKLNRAFQPGSTFDCKSGGLNIRSTLHTVVPNSKIGWSGKAFGAFAIHNWTFIERSGYTEVHVEESMEGWLVNLMRRKFQAGLEQSLDRWLLNLKKQSEKQ